jgi:cell wall-associated NlpC family hydrolase
VDRIPNDTPLTTIHSPFTVAIMKCIMFRKPYILLLLSVIVACNDKGSSSVTIINDSVDLHDTLLPPPIIDTPDANTGYPGQPAAVLNTATLNASELVSFAKTQLGVPYKYASTDPAQGFDCSGFITYVFNHFGVDVPRSSIDFTNVGDDVSVQQALPGDLILFTGTDSLTREVGHMGIITDNNEGKLEFIHSTSGKQKSVVITPFEEYYKSRFVKVIRVLK